MRREATILGIETSCDETTVALVRCQKKGGNFSFTVLENIVHSQIPTHRQHGGVVPEVAAREHAVRLPLLLKRLGERYGLNSLKRRVDAVAVTAGPGLVTSLVVGVEVARTISYVWRKPIIPVNHLEGHIYTNLLPEGSRQIRNSKFEIRKFEFPLVALIVSGGHTELVLMKRHLNYKLLGSTRDDAAGEAFDKTAKLLGLPYPGGPALARLAGRGNPAAIAFPRPMLEQKNLDFSFAGLKTAVAVYLQKNRGQANPKLYSHILKNMRIVNRVSRADVAASVEAAIVEALVAKTLRAVERTKPKMIVLAGGVAANLALRRSLRRTLAARFPAVQFLEPPLAYATDNAAMIAAAGAMRFLNGRTTTWQRLTVDPQFPLRRTRQNHK